MAELVAELAAARAEARRGKQRLAVEVGRMPPLDTSHEKGTFGPSDPSMLRAPALILSKIGAQTADNELHFSKLILDEKGFMVFIIS